MTTYHSKIGWGLATFLFGILGCTIALMWSSESWGGIILVGGVLAFCVHLFLTTCYTVVDDQLLVRSGFIFKEDIPIHAISQIIPTNNPISSPAASLDRLEITYRQGQKVLISPRAKAEFVAHLLKINPDIVVVGW
ncbi:MAG: PH domain-containing protein [Bacteroidota bacterium]